MIRRLPRLLWLILAASVLVRLAAALYLGNQVVPLPGTFDQVSYDMLARRVLDGHGFTVAAQWWPATRAGEPTAHWSFLYTGFLTLVYGLVGYQPLVARLLQALVVGLLLPLGLFQLGRRTFGERVGLWAAALGAFYIYFIYYSATLMTEMFTILVMIWLLVVTLDLAARPTTWRWLAFGLLIGLGALLRQVTLVMVPVLSLWLLWRRRSVATVGGLVLAAGVALILILPVTARNWQVFGRFVLLNTNNGYAFFFANHPVHGVNFQGILEEAGPSYTDLIPTELRPLDEAALNDALMDRAMHIIAENPVRYLLLSASRVEDYFKFWPSPDSSTLSNISRVLSFALYLPFMIYGLWLSRRSAGVVMPLYLFLGAYTLIHLLSWALIRYRLPVDAVLMVFAGLACDRLFSARMMDLPWLAPSWPRTARPSAPNSGGGVGGRSRIARNLCLDSHRPPFPAPRIGGGWRAQRAGRGRAGRGRAGRGRAGSGRVGSGLLSLAAPFFATALIAGAAALTQGPRPAHALRLADVVRQIASQTATPFLVLTSTPTPTAPAPPGTPSANRTASPVPGAMDGAGRDPGSGAGSGAPPGLPTEAPLDLAPPALPGGQSPGVPGGPGGAPGPAGSPATAGDVPGPGGLLRVPVEEPAVSAMWRRFGSPRAQQPVMQRLTSARPAPWDWTLFYVALTMLWAWVLWRVWRAIGRLGGAGEADGRL